MNTILVLYFLLGGLGGGGVENNIFGTPLNIAKSASDYISSTAVKLNSYFTPKISHRIM